MIQLVNKYWDKEKEIMVEGLRISDIEKSISNIMGIADKLMTQVEELLPHLEKHQTLDGSICMMRLKNMSFNLEHFIKKTLLTTETKQREFKSNFIDSQRKIFEALNEAERNVGCIKEDGCDYIFNGKKYNFSRYARSARDSALIAETARLAGVKELEVVCAFDFAKFGKNLNGN